MYCNDIVSWPDSTCPGVGCLLSLEIEAVPLRFWCNSQFNATQSSVISRVVKWYTGYFDNVFREPRLHGTDWLYSWEKRLQKAWRIRPFNLQKAYLYLIIETCEIQLSGAENCFSVLVETGVYSRGSKQMVSLGKHVFCLW